MSLGGEIKKIRELLEDDEYLPVEASGLIRDFFHHYNGKIGIKDFEKLIKTWESRYDRGAMGWS